MARLTANLMKLIFQIGGNDVPLPYNGNGFTVIKSGKFVVLEAPECGVEVSEHVHQVAPMIGRAYFVLYFNLPRNG